MGREEGLDRLLGRSAIACFVAEDSTSTDRESNFSMSACEYAAPTTVFEFWLPGLVTFRLGVCSRGGGLQNGEADLSSR